MRDLSRVAIVDHLSAGGVSRFLLALITHMATLYPQTEIHYFVSDLNVERDNLDEKLADYPNVHLKPIESPLRPQLEAEARAAAEAARAAEAGGSAEPTAPADAPKQRGLWWQIPVGILKKMPWLHKRLLGVWIAVERLISPPPKEFWYYRMPDDLVEQLNAYDVVYLGWPYYTEPVKITVPLVATFHDFHFRQFPEAYGEEQRRLVERETRTWLKKCTTAITSTKFIRDELLSYYGAFAPPVEVVYLAPYGFTRPSEEQIESTLHRLGVTHPYAIFSGGRSGHKNFVAILEAVGILKQQGTPVHLAVTGLGADAIGRPSNEHPADPIHRMNQLVREYDLIRGVDYFPLGYVANEDVDALSSGADVVVSASLYEAGCGPANDAWQAGVPVAFSNIPPFLEQIERFGVQAWVFDPHDPADVADKIHSAVFDTEATQRMVEQSLQAFESYTWDDVAHGYYRVFAEAAKRR